MAITVVGILVYYLLSYGQMGIQGPPLLEEWPTDFLISFFSNLPTIFFQLCTFSEPSIRPKSKCIAKRACGVTTIEGVHWIRSLVTVKVMSYSPFVSQANKRHFGRRI